MDNFGSMVARVPGCARNSDRFGHRVSMAADQRPPPGPLPKRNSQTGQAKTLLSTDGILPPVISFRLWEISAGANAEIDGCGGGFAATLGVTTHAIAVAAGVAAIAAVDFAQAATITVESRGDQQLA
jgi:hypothetical protein